MVFVSEHNRDAKEREKRIQRFSGNVLPIFLPAQKLRGKVVAAII